MKRILIEDARYTPLFRKLGFDYLAFFQADPGFTRLFAGYRLGPRYGRISVYELAADRPPPRTANCRIVY